MIVKKQTIIFAGFFCAVILAGSAMRAFSLKKAWKSTTHVVEKGAKEVGKAAQTAEKTVEKGAEQAAKGATKAGTAVVKTTESVAVTVGGKTIGGTIVSVGGAVGDVAVKAGKGAGQVVVNVGKGAADVALDPGAAIKQGGNLIINVGGQVLSVAEDAVNTIAECGQAAAYGSELVGLTALQSAADTVGGALDKIFNIQSVSLEGDSSQLLAAGDLPEFTVKGNLLGKSVTFKAKLNLNNPAESVENIVDQIVKLL